MNEINNARSAAKALDDEALLQYLDEHDPDAEHDDLSDPESPLAEYWREAGDRGLLNQ